MPYKCKEKALANKRERYVRDEFPSLRRLKQHLKTSFKMQYQEFNALLELQAGKCALCRKDEPGPNKRLSVDHCWKTGKVRGLLCSICNTSLRQVDAVPGWTANALFYVGQD